MGIKTKITKEDLPLKYQNYELRETKDGVSDSVYLIGDKYVLKIYEELNYDIKSEKKLLNDISTLKSIQYVESFKINQKHSIVYKQSLGKSLVSPSKTHIKQISSFLKEFHNITKDKTSKNEQIFSKNYLNNMIQNSGNKLLQNYFDNIQIELKNDGIIHGDIFLDNVLFEDDKLSAVLDFSEACNGDFLFDLAVVAISWCFDDEVLNYNKLDTLLQTYDSSVEIDTFKEYMKYALVYFATIRFIDNRNYQGLLNRLESISTTN